LFPLPSPNTGPGFGVGNLRRGASREPAGLQAAATRAWRRLSPWWRSGLPRLLRRASGRPARRRPPRHRQAGSWLSYPAPARRCRVRSDTRQRSSPAG
jgi:hypothetical protein